MHIREIKVSDAETFSHLTANVEASSPFMLWESGERMVDQNEQRQRIESMNKSENSTILVAENDHELIGYLVAIGGSARRSKHCVYIVIGIVSDYRGQGIGRKLFEKMEKWAREKNIHRLELTVVADNIAGVSLYKKMGFEIEGTKRHSLCINGKFFDEYYMSKLL